MTSVSTYEEEEKPKAIIVAPKLNNIVKLNVSIISYMLY